MFPIDLLSPPSKVAGVRLRDPTDTARLLEAKCRERGIVGYVRGIRFGPLVTTFDFQLAVGQQFNELESVVDDLGRAVQATPVRIERVPDRPLVGIQISNPGRQTITLREVLESEAYQRSPSVLTIALGKTATGEPCVTDLMTMPHLLIAGSKGAGKSVGLVALLTSVLHRATPDDVRLVLLDPTRSGLAVYEGIPHLLTPVITDPGRGTNALQWTAREMERRFQLLAAKGVRNRVQYNRAIRQATVEPATVQPPLEPMPSIVVVVSELAQLMMAAPFDVEDAIVRLAQMSRPVGIHLVLATEHSSVGVITGFIKVNLPARIAYRVRTSSESRAIVDCSGAERLLGNGDMLFLPPSSRDCLRVHGSYITEQEVSRAASYLRREAPPTLDPSITADDGQEVRVREPEADPLHRAAAHLVRATGTTSVSYLQRRLGIGFSRAVRLLDRIRTEGLG